MFQKILLAVFVAIVLLVAFEWATWPDVARLATEMPRSTAFMDLRREELRAEGKSDVLAYQPVAYERISPYLRRGVLVAEDDNFYEHGGVDTEAMKEAIQKDWKRKRITHGGSTITQQLAKNLYLSPSRNPLRKLKEYFLARSLERHLTKKRILEIYLNVVEMGERTYGAEAASQLYFAKPASALSPQEAALLAGCLPNPRAMSPGAPNRRLRARQRMILSRLRRWGYLFEREVLTEKAPQPAPQPAPPAVDTALQQAPTGDAASPANDTSATMSGTATAGTTGSEAAPTESAPPAVTTSTTDTSQTAPPPP